MRVQYQGNATLSDLLPATNLVIKNPRVFQLLAGLTLLAWGAVVYTLLRLFGRGLTASRLQRQILRDFKRDG